MFVIYIELIPVYGQNKRKKRKKENRYNDLFYYKKSSNEKTYLLDFQMLAQLIRFVLTTHVIQRIILAYTKHCSAIFWVDKNPTSFH